MRPNLLLFISVSSSERRLRLPIPLPLLSLIFYPLFIGAYCFFRIYPTGWRRIQEGMRDDEVLERWDPGPEIFLNILRVYRRLRWAGSFELVDVRSSDGEQVSIRLR